MRNGAGDLPSLQPRRAAAVSLATPSVVAVGAVGDRAVDRGDVGEGARLRSNPARPRLARLLGGLLARVFGSAVSPIWSWVARVGRFA